MNIELNELAALPNTVVSRGAENSMDKHNSTDTRATAQRAVASGPLVREVPKGHQPAPGFILDVFDGSAWLRADGSVTDKWEERGVWATEASARDALDRFFTPNK